MPGHPRQFDTTRWSLIHAAGGADSTAARQALAELCEAYWYPLYAYVRRQGHDADAARDSIQSFFVLLLERQDIQSLRPERGRFRSFLLASLRHFLDNQRIHEGALKRGGSTVILPLEFDAAEARYREEPVDARTPETIFDRRWALALVDQVFSRIRLEWNAKGQAAEFDALKGCLMGEPPEGGYGALAHAIGVSEAVVKMNVHRLKRRFQRELRAAIADTLTDDAVDDELRYLLNALRS